MSSAARWVVAGAVACLAAPSVLAQRVPGVTGTVALEGTVQQEYGAANIVTVKTVDGVRHVFHFTKDLLVHGGKHGGPEPLADLREGTTVVVHYTVQGADATAQEIDQIGDDGLAVTEGVVTDINRRRRQITVRFDNGTSQVFELTDRAAADAGKELDRPDGSRVVVYYADEAGRKVAHFFKPAR